MNALTRSLFLSVLGLSTLTGRGFAHSAIEPVPRGEEWWQTRHKALSANAREAGDKAQVIFIGDSITQGWEGAGKEIWSQYYAPRNAVNLGIGGDRTQHVLWRLENGNLEGIHPKAAVVMIGTNNSNGEDNTVEQIADGVTAIVKKLREVLPATKIVLVPIFPRSENPSPQRGKVLQVNQILQKLADDTSVFWVDFGYKFLRSDGSIPGELMPDFLHLSPAGYRIWAESIEPRLVSILGDKAGDTEPRTRAAANGDTKANDLTGDWMAAVPGPGGEPVDVPFTLKQEGNVLSGQFNRPDGRAMKIENGKISGGEFSWTMNRDRPDGSIMRYEMSGKQEGGQLKGKTRTDVEGNPVTVEWTAKRR